MKIRELSVCIFRLVCLWFFVHPSVYLTLYLSVCLSVSTVCQSVWLICLSVSAICVSVCISVCLFVCLSVRHKKRKLFWFCAFRYRQYIRASACLLWWIFFLDPQCRMASATEPQLFITSRKHSAWLHTHLLKSLLACCHLSNPGLNLISRNHCTWHANWFWNNSSCPLTTALQQKKNVAIKVNNIPSLSFESALVHGLPRRCFSRALMIVYEYTVIVPGQFNEALISLWVDL